jgi:hypothetical protein
MKTSTRNNMTHLQIIQGAYDKVSIKYRVASYHDEQGTLWSYLILTGDRESKIKEVDEANGSESRIDKLLIQNPTFIEFEDGKIASY